MQRPTLAMDINSRPAYPLQAGIANAALQSADELENQYDTNGVSEGNNRAPATYDNRELPPRPLSSFAQSGRTSAMNFTTPTSQETPVRNSFQVSSEDNHVGDSSNTLKSGSFRNATHRIGIVHFSRRALTYAILAVLLAAGMATIALTYPSHKITTGNSLTTTRSINQHYDAQAVSLSGIPAFPHTNLGTLGTVSVNGDLDISNTLVLEPTTKPSEATSGQIYYNAKTHQLSLFNGTNFTQLLTSDSEVINSLGSSIHTLQANSNAGGSSDVTTSTTDTGSLTSLTLGSVNDMGSLLLQDGTGFTGTVRISSDGLSQDTMYVLPAVDQAIVKICTSAGNCVPNGNNPGDILYWNGTKWVTLTLPTGGDRTYGLLACNGALVWQDCPPTVTTGAVVNIGGNGATGKGNIVSDNGLDITEHGIVYSTAQNPTITDNKVTNTVDGLGSFTVDMPNLIKNTTYYVRAYATNSAGTAYGNEVSFTTLNIQTPTVTTIAITDTDTTATTANGGGDVTDGGDAPVTEVGLVYSTTQDPTTADHKVSSGSGIGNFTTTLTGLTGNTTYYVRAYAINTGGTAYGNQISFTTPTVPTIATSLITNIANGSATGGGNVTDDGHHPVTERGIVYSTSQNPTLADTKIVSGSGTGTFTASMTELRGGTTYYVRAYATNSIGTGYGNDVSFVASGYAVGSTGPAGGTVFYDKGSYSNGWRYLEAASSDALSGSSNIEWACNVAIPGAYGTAIGAGQQNTTNMVAYSNCQPQYTGDSMAAKVANSFILNGYSDWFLPSKDELNKMHQNKAIIGGFANTNYWSSSESSTGHAWEQNFSDGSQIISTYYGRYRVRPIREF